MGKRVHKPPYNNFDFRVGKYICYYCKETIDPKFSDPQQPVRASPYIVWKQGGTSGYIICTTIVLTLVLSSGGGNIVKMKAKLAEVATMHFVMHNGLPVIVASEVRAVLRRLGLAWLGLAWHCQCHAHQ